MAKVFLGLGSNLGDTQSNLMLAIQEIEKRIGRIVSQSAFHITRPWGFESDHLFCNAAICVETNLKAEELLHITQTIEKSMGRTTKSSETGYSDRVVDIDLLAIDDWVLEMNDLILPHPLMHQRRFVLQPMSEIASNWIHPLIKKNIIELINELYLYEK